MERIASGDLVLTQWFEQARFEYHPDNPAAYESCFVDWVLNLRPCGRRWERWA
jgi:hypothetical protein